MKIQKFIHGEWQEGKTLGVFYVPNLKKNLIFEGLLASKNMAIIKMQDLGDIYSCEDKLVGTTVQSCNFS